MKSVITGTGSYIPTIIKKNIDFSNERFYCDKNKPFEASNEEIIEKFKAITGIEERRYATADQDSSTSARLPSRSAKLALCCTAALGGEVHPSPEP